MPYYDDIQRIFKTDSLPFDASLLPAMKQSPVPFSPDVILRYSKWAPFKMRNMANTVGADAVADPRITVFTHANVATLECAGGAVQLARAVNYAGAAFTFRAKYFVVATGTIESSRLLLCSPTVPNRFDRIGRNFNDHLSFHAAQLDSPAREQAIARFGPFFVDGTLHTCKLEASPELRARTRLYAAMAHFVVIEPEDSGIGAIRNLLRSIQTGKLKQAIGTNLMPMLRGTGDVVRLLFQAKFKKRRAISSRAQVMLNVDVEQAPNPDNRIRLSSRLDALGIPVAVVDWRVGQPERETAVAYARVIREELRRLGLTAMRWHPCVDDGSVPPLLDTFHPMGGLAMGTDPETSVVDANLKLHQVDNLYVASCAVFTSGSSSNPTFTMMALTMRLAEHLHGVIKTAR